LQNRKSPKAKRLKGKNWIDLASIIRIDLHSRSAANFLFDLWVHAMFLVNESHPHKQCPHEATTSICDADEGLILSAAHVVRGLNGMAGIAFPRDIKRHRARVLIPKPGDSDEPDLSVLQLDPALNGLHAMEVQFDAIHEEEEHRITGFGRENPEPVHGRAQPSKTDECTYTLRNATLHGDSGSALLSPQGLVDGIAVRGVETTGFGSMAEMKVLPLSCVRDLILNLVSGTQNDKIMNIVWTAGDLEFRGALQPRPSAGSG
jgi:hypothetical protein